ncbi:MAG TPA: ATP-binding protein [Rhizomicrobium sp.]|nr:ATP-binding protein [Rhizomicrobium sp.]
MPTQGAKEGLAGAEAEPSPYEIGDITVLGLGLTARLRMDMFPILLALSCGLIARSLSSLFPAPSVLPVMWGLGALLSAFIAGRSRYWALAPVVLFLGFLPDPPPVSLPEQLALAAAVAAGGLVIDRLRSRLAPDIRPGMTAKQIATVSCLGFLAGLVTTCVWAIGYALARKVFPSPGIFAGALLRLSLSVLVWLPLFVAWMDPPRRPNLRRLLHFALVMLMTAANSVLVYLCGLHEALAWTALPLLVWAALAFRARGVSVAMVIVSCIALYATTHGLGVFYPHDLGHVLMMEFFAATVTVTMLLVARLADKRQTEEAWAEARREAVQARHAAEEATARYRAIFDQTQVGIARSTLERRFFDVNRPACIIAGRSREQMLSIGPEDITAPEDWAVMQQATQEMLAGKRMSIEREERIVTGDGLRRWIRLNVSLVRSPGGKPLEFVTVVQDITPRKTAEFALAESEARWRLAQEVAGVGAWEFHESRGTSYFSAISQAHFRLEPRPSGLYSFADVRAQMGAAFDAFNRELLRAIIGRSNFDFKLAVPSGENDVRWIRVLGGYDGGQADGPLLGLTMDITEQIEGETRLRAARDQVLRVSRLSAMGSMASTLAHELNQPLAAIANFSAAGRHMLLGPNRPGDDKIIDLLDRTAVQARRAGEIIRKMRQFTVTGEVSLNPEDLGEILAAACEMVRERKDSAGVRILCEADADLPKAMADRIQLEQVVGNLVANAAQATAGCAVREVSVKAARDGDHILVSVADSGVGIPADVRENLFEPFRTTKEKGMGLGLPICRTIIEAHGGKLWAEDNSPRGSIFRFTLAMAEDGG